MPITTIPDPGVGSAIPILRAKINEIIAAINAMQALLTGGAVTQMTWCRYSYDEEEIVGQGANFASVEVVGLATRFTFTEPFASADDYCAQMTPDASGPSNVDHVLNQTAEYVDLFFLTDGGGGIVPSSGEVNLTITYNASL